MQSLELLLYPYQTILLYYLSGLAMGAVLVRYGGNNLMRLSLSGRIELPLLLSCIVAAFAGAVSPITLFGLIPLILAMKQETAERLRAPLTAFMVTSLLISPNIFIFTLSLGLHIAILRLMLTIFAGILAGLSVEMLPSGSRWFEWSSDSPEEQGFSSTAAARPLPVLFFRALKKTFPRLLLGIGLSLALAVAVPDRWWQFLFGNRWGGSLVSTLFSVPLYYCGGGTIPLIQGWMNEGMGTGSAAAFMLAGPVTKMTNVTALSLLMKKSRLIFLLSALILFSIIVGMILDLLLP